MSNLFRKKEVHLFYNLGTDKRPEKFRPQTVDKALLLQGFAIVGTAFLI